MPSPRHKAAHISLVPVSTGVFALSPLLPPKDSHADDDLQAAFLATLFLMLNHTTPFSNHLMNDILEMNPKDPSLATVTLTTVMSEGVTLTIKVKPTMSDALRRAWASACLQAAHGITKTSLAESSPDASHKDKSMWGGSVFD